MGFMALTGLVLGISTSFPALAHLSSSVLLAVLLIAAVLEPWIPLFEYQLCLPDHRMEFLSIRTSKLHGAAQRIEIVGWLIFAFVVITFSVARQELWTAWLSDIQFGFLQNFYFWLVNLLLISLFAILISKLLKRVDRIRQSESLFLRCLFHFQINGWVLVGLTGLMVSLHPRAI